MAQQLIVGLIVAAAALYAVWRWMPAGWRRAAAQRLGSATQRAGLIDAGRADRLAASLAKPSGCGACDTCGGCGKAEEKASTPQASDRPRQRRGAGVTAASAVEPSAAARRPASGAHPTGAR